LQAQAVKDSVGHRENEILQDLYSPQPKMTVQSIANDQGSPDAGRQGADDLGCWSGARDSKEDKTYGKGFYDAYSGPCAGWHAGPITDPSDALSHASGRKAI
jgi:hypothetical protein